MTDSSGLTKLTWKKKIDYAASGTVAPIEVNNSRFFGYRETGDTFGIKPYLISKEYVPVGEPYDYLAMMDTKFTLGENNAWVVIRKPYKQREYHVIQPPGYSEEYYPTEIYLENATSSSTGLSIQGISNKGSSTIANVVANFDTKGSYYLCAKDTKGNVIKNKITTDIVGWYPVTSSIAGVIFGITDLVEYNSKIYGVASYDNLYEWNGIDAWVEKAGAGVYCLAVFNSKLYGGGTNGKLYEWNGTDAWVEKAGVLGDEILINSMLVFNSKLYGGTGPNGKLYEWNGTDAWVEVAPSYHANAKFITDMVEFNGELYGGCGVGVDSGYLLKWNGVDEWIGVLTEILDNNGISRLIVFDGNLYGGMNGGGVILSDLCRLDYWEGYGYYWQSVSYEKSGGGTITGLVEFPSIPSNILYGTSIYGRLLEDNDTAFWKVAATPYNSEYIYSLIVFNGEIYGGSASGYLLKWFQ